MKFKVLVITISIGSDYQKIYEKYFIENHKKFCEAFSFDFKNITNFIDKNTTKKSLTSAQKILICNCENADNYDFLIFLDCDIFINIENAKKHINDLFQFPEKIMIVDEYDQHGFENRININKAMGWESSASEYYVNFGHKIKTSKVLNSGFFVLSPKFQKKFMEKIYSFVSLNVKMHSNYFHFEQSTFGYNLQNEKKFSLLNNKWNYLFTIDELFKKKSLLNKIFYSRKKRLKSIFKSNIMIHFAGGSYKYFKPHFLKKLN